MTDVISRLHRYLLDALEQTRDDPFDKPVTVAEIYQDLVPYRRARTALGVELNADFEHALLRLLAGEDDRVRLEPEQARDELARELESPNPNVGLYRKFAACDVWILPLPEGEAALGAAETPAPGPRAGEGTGPTSWELELDDEVEPAPAGDAADRPSSQCVSCHRVLPGDREVRYCPFCGADQRRQLCPECGETLERGWRYCTRCGHDMAPGTA